MTEANGNLGLVLTRMEGEDIVVADTEDKSAYPLLITLVDIRQGKNKARVGINATDRYEIHRGNRLEKTMEGGSELMRKIRTGEPLSSGERELLNTYVGVEERR